MVIAIDGPAGGGKSALASLIAEKKHFFLLNSGYFYRALTYKALKTGMILEEKNLTGLAVHTLLEIHADGFYMDGLNISAHLHDDEVSKNVAQVSSIAAVREILNEKMRAIARDVDLVCEGRDMTSVVFPEAEIKIYLDASIKTRAKRRFDQGVSNLTLDQIEKSIQNRDTIDKNKAVGALIIAKDAHYIDSSNLTLEQVYEKIEKMMNHAK